MHATDRQTGCIPQYIYFCYCFYIRFRPRPPIPSSPLPFALLVPVGTQALTTANTLTPLSDGASRNTHARSASFSLASTHLLARLRTSVCRVHLTSRLLDCSSTRDTMATNNQIPDSMAANYWPHPAYLGPPPRQAQDDYPAPLPHLMAPMQPCLAGVGGSTATGFAAPSEIRQHNLATPSTASSTFPADTITSTAAGGGATRTERTGRPQHEEDGLAATATAAAASQKPIRRRMRMITSCLECRRRKLKCEKKHPCSNCKRFQRECVYLGPNLDEVSQQRLTEIKEKVGSLERQLERDVAKGATGRRKGSPGGGGGDGSDSSQQRFVADDVEEELGEERDLQITPMVALDLTYDDYSDGNGADDLIDLGVRVGKMRITERIGGLNRPRISEEACPSLRASLYSRGLADAAQIQAGMADANQGLVYGSHAAFASDELQDAPDLPDFLKPGETYLAPTSGFFFGQSGQPLSFINLLPSTDFGHRLMRRYFDAVHPIARCVHRPSLEASYTAFWEDVRQNIEPRASVQAVVFAAWFSAAVSVDEGFCRGQECNKTQLVFHMKIGTETALSKAGFLSTTRFETIQAFVMYLVSFPRGWVLDPGLIRQAY